MPPLSSPGSSSPIAGDTTALITDPSDEFDVVDTGPPSADDTQNQSTVPEDARSRVWYAIVLCGAGFLFPFNTYIAAADFLEQRYSVCACHGAPFTDLARSLTPLSLLSPSSPRNLGPWPSGSVVCVTTASASSAPLSTLQRECVCECVSVCRETAVDLWERGVFRWYS
jgi:hypothetical protein